MKVNQISFGFTRCAGTFSSGKICMLLLLLSGLGNLVFSQESKIQQSITDNSTYEMSTNSLLSNEYESIEVMAVACVNSYANQTVSSTVTVSGCSTLTVQNVTVTGSGNLTLLAPTGFIINKPFTVQPGGKLYMDFKRIGVDYAYDNVGNRIMRQPIPTMLYGELSNTADEEVFTTIQESL